MKRHLILSLCAWGTASSAFALEPDCEKILAASEKKIQQPAWHSVSAVEGTTQMEAIKLNGKFYQKISNAWMAAPMSLDDAERQMNQMIRSGKAKLLECKTLDSETLDGKPMNVISSRTEMPGLPASSASKLYVGKDDGLPYLQTSDKIKVVYKYTGIKAPQ